MYIYIYTYIPIYFALLLRSLRRLVYLTCRCGIPFSTRACSGSISLSLYIYTDRQIYTYVHIYICIHIYTYLFCVAPSQLASLDVADVSLRDPVCNAGVLGFKIHTHIYIYIYIYIYLTSFSVPSSRHSVYPTCRCGTQSLTRAYSGSTYIDR